MRIVGGNLKGRSLVTPKGRSTRPTSDRAREAVFNLLTHADWAPSLAGARVMDLFAGSGALGFEAISRGAAFCLFVETDASARGAIRENTEALGLFGVTRTHRRSATDLGRRPSGVGEPFGLVFLDPPYGKQLVPLALEAALRGNWLSPDVVAVTEVGAGETLVTPGWRTLDQRQYGAADIHVLRPVSSSG